MERSDIRAEYMPQNYEDQLDLSLTPVEYLNTTGDKEEMTRIRTYLGALKYTADEMDHPIRELSGGQKAKVLLLKMSLSNANVLILDEPTSALDPIAEYEIYQHFNSLTKGKTTIYISHRLSSARFTNKVAVISDGNLCEFGSHEELISIENGLYHEMFKMQAQHYN